MTSKPVIIIGNGGHASVLTEILRLNNRVIIGFTAPEPQTSRYNLRYLGRDEIINQFDSSEIELVLGIGTIGVSDMREKLFNENKKNGYIFATLIHPSSIISSTVFLGEGVQIMAGTILQSHTRIADNSIINTGVIIDHDCDIGAHVHIAPGCKLSGGIRVESNCHIGTGTTIIQEKIVGHHSLVGAGAVVVCDIGSYKKVMGNPAKEV